MPRTMKQLGHAILRDLRENVPGAQEMTISHLYEVLAAYHGHATYANWKHHGFPVGKDSSCRRRAVIRLAQLSYTEGQAMAIVDAIERHDMEDHQ